MADMGRQQARGRQPLSQVVKQQRKDHFRRPSQPCSQVHCHQDMNAGINFGVVLLRLRYAEQAIDFG